MLEVIMPRILIADDNQQNAELLEAHLDGVGFDTKIAINGEDTLAAALDWKPDLILLDVMMPKLSGFEVCQRLRANAATRDVAVLMVTALDQPTDVERAVDVGTDDFITKPINKTELLLRVRAMLESRSKPNDLERTLEYIGRVQQGN
jgi:two-component system, OmpR family, alkaline phosphatase synthesis response regulator PhoP